MTIIDKLIILANTLHYHEMLMQRSSGRQANERRELSFICQFTHAAPGSVLVSLVTPKSFVQPAQKKAYYTFTLK